VKATTVKAKATVKAMRVRAGEYVLKAPGGRFLATRLDHGWYLLRVERGSLALAGFPANRDTGGPYMPEGTFERLRDARRHVERHWA